MISYEKELDIDNKLHNYEYLKITGILNNVFKPQKALKKTRLNYTIHWPSQSCYTEANLGPLKQGTPEE